MSDVANVLWTGGWDSTFRVLELVLIQQREVQPVYVIDEQRRSTLQELQAMAAIREAVHARTPTPELLRPTHFAARGDLKAAPELADAFRQLATRARIGKQYEWLAEFAAQAQWRDLELCMERSEVPTDFEWIVFDDPQGAWPGVTDEGRKLFGAFSFPVLHLTKSDMLRISQRHGFRDVLELSWFCHQPAWGKPCGYCNPCTQARTSRTGVRFSRIMPWYYEPRRLARFPGSIARRAARLAGVSRR